MLLHNLEITIVVFFVKNGRIGRDQLDVMLTGSLHTSVWIDGLQSQVLVRVKAFKEISTFLQAMNIEEEIDHPAIIMKTFLLEMIQLYEEFNTYEGILG